MRFYAGLTQLFCSPQAILRRATWPKDEKIILQGKRIARTGSCDSIPIEDFDANDWEIIEPEENDKE